MFIHALKKTTKTPARMEESPESEHGTHADSPPAVAVRQAPKTIRKYGARYKHEAYNQLHLPP
jgi:hypothetical protein